MLNKNVSPGVKVMSLRSGIIAGISFSFLFILSSGAALNAQTPAKAPLRPEVKRDLPPGCGFVPPRLDWSHLSAGRPAAAYKTTALPSRWDWREQGVVTSVKNQGSCGSCYAFASLANIESRLMIDGEAAYNFSENNAKECNWYQSSCDGGSYDDMAAFFSQAGLVLEACDPYVAFDVVCNTGCAFVKSLLDWRIIIGDTVPATADLKQYIYDEGPVFTTLYAGDGFDPDWWAEYSAYNGSYTMYYTGIYAPNHAVLIVGWDDDLVHDGGSGGWIVKNSWGTSWGGTCDYGSESGYFYIAYGSASIGKYSSYVYDVQDYDADDQVLYYDEGGASAHWGYYDPSAWAMSKFVMPSTAYPVRVELWTNDATTDIDVRVYDDFNGLSFSNLLASKLDQSFTEAGYHSITLESPPEITAGEDIYVSVHITNASYGLPICCDAMGPWETSTTYLSSTGFAGSWYDMGVNENTDVAIRVRTTPTLDLAVADDPISIPYEFNLLDNYPNPFNPSTTIRYTLQRRAEVRISVYNILGKKVCTLVDGVKPAGEHSIIWDGKDSDGKEVASGIYLYRLIAGDYVDSRKMVLLR